MASVGFTHDYGMLNARFALCWKFALLASLRYQQKGREVTV